MSTNLKEIAIEELITSHLVNENGFVQRFYNEADKGKYDKKEVVDLDMLFDFLESSQKEEVEKLKTNYGESYKQRFLVRLQKKINEAGVLEVLKKGIKDLDARFKLMYFEPNSNLNPELQENWEKNIFAVARQFHYSEENNNSLDMVILVNGLPIITMELKNLLSGQNVKNAIRQYQNDRSSKEKIFNFERCLVHFAVDTELVYMTTKLADKKTWFLPFNKGDGDGAGNPVNPSGIKTDYLWKDVLTKSSLSRIIGNFMQKVIEEKVDRKTGKTRKIEKLIFPRYQQLDVVRKVLEDVRQKGAGQKYLIQHSAGSGKSNSISWLAHQLSELHLEDGRTNAFDSILIITDRRVLDRQLRETVAGFDHQRGVVVPVESGKELQEALETGKRIIVSTIQKFPVIVDSIESLGTYKFAVIIDEAHSSTSGEMVSQMNRSIGIEDEEKEEKTDEDIVLEALKGRKMLANASYFAFTATPKNKTLEIFGIKNKDGKFVPFHSYTMKQAIEEGFILDVLRNYTTYDSYYKLAITGEKGKKYDKKHANKQLRSYVESHEHTIEIKAKIMINHFYNQVYLKGLIGGRAKAMVVCQSRINAVKYHFAFKKIITENNYPLGIITAFSGEVKLDGNSWTEANLNKFSSSLIVDEFDGGGYQVLIVANKFQTGFDQPLLQTMYVDKKLGGVTAVQTLSRLNRTHPDKDSVFVLDFYNTTDDIKNAFEPYYKTTTLSEGSDPNKLHDLKDALDNFNVYTEFLVDTFTEKILKGAPVETLHNLLDSAVENVKALQKDEIEDFKAKSKSYVRFYAFIAQILPYDITDFEKLYHFLKVLNKKIITLGKKDEDISQDVLDSIDFDSYRNQKINSNARISLSKSDELPPIPSSDGKKVENPKELLENIVSEFNERFGTNFKDEDKVRQIISDLSDDIANDSQILKSLQDSDMANRKLVFKKRLDGKMTDNVDSHLELFNNYHGNSDFQEYLIQSIDKIVKEKLKEKV
jgi:type I restriction enzyme R subunit